MKPYTQNGMKRVGVNVDQMQVFVTISLKTGKIVFQKQYVCRREIVTQYMIKLPVFKKKKCSYLYQNFVSV